MEVSLRGPVLVVEDDPDLAAMFSRALEGAGLQVDRAASGPQALEAAARNEPGAVLLDIMLPGMDGFEVLRRLRARGPRELPILMLTGVAAVEDKERAFAEGADDYLVKPVNLRELLARVRAHAERAALQRALDSEHGRLRAALRERELLHATLEESWRDTLRLLAALVELEDPRLGAHARATADLARRAGRLLGFSAPELDALEAAALLHDAGLLALPREVRHSAARTPEEEEIFRRHPQLGAQVVASVPALAAAAELVRAHHERWDGSGYPLGLRGEAIAPLARLLAAASFAQEARAKMELDAAARAVEAEAGRALEPRAAEAAARALRQAEARAREAAVPVGELLHGMVLARDLKTSGGRLLLARGTALSAPLVEKIRAHRALGAIARTVPVVAGAQEK